VIGWGKVLVAAALSAISTLALSQPFPNRPIRFVVPFAPGGPADIAARTVAVKATELLGQPMVIDNRPGGGGVAGAEIVAKAKPDGHTVLLCSTSVLVFNPLVMPNVPYDPLRDFTHLSLVMSAPYLLLVHPAFPAKDVKELIAVAKVKPGGLNFGSSGIGSAAHLTAERFKSMAGIQMMHVPYKGSGPAAIDLMAGQLHLVFESLASALQHVNAGRLRTLGISTLHRFPLTPQIATINESGVPGFESTSWQGMCAPAGTPKPIVAALNRAISQAVRSPEASERLAALGAQAVGNSPEAFLAFVKAEIPRWAKAIRDSGAKPQ
jgi:tripartite-type tricarboxylate transporter receptor subunit TctC